MVYSILSGRQALRYGGGVGTGRKQIWSQKTPAEADKIIWTTTIPGGGKPEMTLLTSEGNLKIKWDKDLKMLYKVLVTQSCSPPGSSVYMIFPGKNKEVGSHCLLQGIFPTQGWNWHLLFSCTASRSFTYWAMGEAPSSMRSTTELHPHL